ncbi:hypothetical protein FACS189425_09650 [Clostridia bacterium]|nr:hypothetical protein FACS189425_09650 [Clostridia bacterium]
MFNTSSLTMSYDRSTTKNALEARNFNMAAFSALSRDGLGFGVLERRLVLHTTALGEQVSIQYPGKESKNATADKIRPWDFRPKLMLPTGEFVKDLSFADIWDDLSELHNADKYILVVLAAVFYRMSVMVDHKKVTENYPYADYNLPSLSAKQNGSVSLSWYKYELQSHILSELSGRIGKLRGASLEAYLLYNDLLVQNEDCKYYYRDKVLRGETWDSKIGRKNTLLSHLSIIEYLKGEIKFSEIMNRFQRGRGVASMPMGRIESVTGRIIKKK